MEQKALAETDAQKERRKNSRVNVQIWAEERYDNFTYFHLLSNLSVGGFFIEKKLPFQVGTIVQLELQLPGSKEKLPVKGQVLNNYQDPHSNNRGAGVKFTEIDKKVKKKIEKYLVKKEKA
jgi:Tfp pilus assembly protein PilZ